MFRRPVPGRPFDPESRSTPDLCFLEVSQWVLAGLGFPTSPFFIPVTSDIDRQYANALLIKKSANSAPPDTLGSPDTFDANKKAFGSFNRLKAYYEDTPLGINASSVNYLQRRADIGQTPEPCTGFQIFQIFAGEAEKHLENGSRGTTT